jgi:hypothetical protein
VIRYVSLLFRHAYATNRLQGIVSQLANQVDSVKNVIGTVAESNTDTLKSVQDVKNAADRSYMIAMVGIGAGVAGIIIAAFSLSRKGVIMTYYKIFG